jgi:hypothetical protein
MGEAQLVIDHSRLTVGGTTLLPPVGCAAETIASLGQGCSAAILQQVSAGRKAACPPC